MTDALKPVATLDEVLTNVETVLNKAPILSMYLGQKGFEEQRFFADYEIFMKERRAVLANLLVVRQTEVV